MPLVREGHALGTILVRRTEVRPFEQKHVELLATFADQAAIAIQNVRLFNETKEALEQQKASAEVLRVISGSVEDAKPVFDAVAEACERLFAGQFVGVNLIDERGGLHLAASRYPTGLEFDRDALAQHFATAPTRTGGTRLKLRGAVVDFPDIDQPGVPDEVVAACRIGHARSIAFAPMVLAGKGIGAIWVARAAPGSMADKDKALFKTFADQAVIAIQNARLFNETKEALEQQTATAEVLRVISDSPTDVQPVFDTIVRRSLQLCDGLFANLFRYDGEQLHFVASHNVIPDQLEILRAQLPDAARRLAGLGAGGAEPGDRAHGGRAGRSGLRQALSPWSAAGAACSACRCCAKAASSARSSSAGSRPGRSSAGHELLLTTFAEQAAIAIENVRLFNETQEALERQTATAEILKVIAGSPSDVQPVFDAIASSSKRLIGGFSTTVFRIVDGVMHLVAYTPTNPQADTVLAATFPRPIAEFPPFAMVSDGQMAHVHDIESDAGVPTLLRDLARLRGFRAMLLAPLVRDTAVIGMISVTRQAPGPFAEHHVQLLRTFADQAVIAIENVRLFNETSEALERQTATAEILQGHRLLARRCAAGVRGIARRARALCDAVVSGVSRFDGEWVHLAAVDGVTPDALDVVRAAFPMRSGAGSINARAIRDRGPVQIADVMSDAGYEAKAAAQRAGYRSGLAVPMLKDDRVVGAIAIFRAQTGDFPRAHGAAAADLRRPGADRDRERAPVQGNAKRRWNSRRPRPTSCASSAARWTTRSRCSTRSSSSCKHLFGSDETAVLLVDDAGQVTLGAYVGQPARRGGRHLPGAAGQVTGRARDRRAACRALCRCRPRSATDARGAQPSRSRAATRRWPTRR